MRRNIQAIREGICRNSGLKERVILLEKGLAEKEEVREKSATASRYAPHEHSLIRYRYESVLEQAFLPFSHL